MNNQPKVDIKNIIKKAKKYLAIGAPVGAVCIIASCSGYTQINPGERGIKTTWGEMQKGVLAEGIYFYTPIKDNVIVLDVKEKVSTQEMGIFSKDVQEVKINYAITFSPQKDKINSLYENYGIDYADKILTPLLSGVVKEVAGKYTAAEMITKRADMVKDINDKVTQNAQKRYINITKIDIVDINFTNEFKNSIESKVIAEQASEREKNNTLRIEELSRQEVIKAEAEAKANLVKAKAEAEATLLKAEAEAKSIKLKSEALIASKTLVEYEAVKQWNGELPKQILGSSITPFVNIKWLLFNFQTSDIWGFMNTAQTNEI